MSGPDSTAVRTALWRALHVQIDPPPHVFVDELGLELAAPDASWRERPDMHPEHTRRMRASIVSRAKFIEELVVAEAARGVDQYVLLGAGLDTFAQRRPEIPVRVFEVDRPGASEWKRARLAELGWRVPVLVPVDFETDSWRDRIVAAGFDATKPAVVASTGVSMYLTREATAETLRQIATLAPGSTLAMTFLVTVDLMEPEDRKAFEWAAKGAAASGTPLATLYRPTELLEMARDFKTAEHVRGQSGEDFLVART